VLDLTDVVTDLLVVEADVVEIGLLVVDCVVDELLVETGVVETGLLVVDCVVDGLLVETGAVETLLVDVGDADVDVPATPEISPKKIPLPFVPIYTLP